MTDADVFAKLSRIIETQDFKDDNDKPVEEILESLASATASNKSSSPPQEKDRDHVKFEESVTSRSKGYGILFSFHMCMIL